VVFLKLLLVGLCFFALPQGIQAKEKAKLLGYGLFSQMISLGMVGIDGARGRSCLAVFLMAENEPDIAAQRGA